MSSPVFDFHNPFEEYALMADRSGAGTPVDATSRRTSPDGTAPSTPSGAKALGKKRVGFSREDAPTARSLSIALGGSGGSTPSYLSDSDIAAPSGLWTDRSLPARLHPDDLEELKRSLQRTPRPAIRKVSSLNLRAHTPSEDDSDHLDNQRAYRKQKAQEALQRGRALEEENVRTLSQPPSLDHSPERPAALAPLEPDPSHTKERFLDSPMLYPSNIGGAVEIAEPDTPDQQPVEADRHAHGADSHRRDSAIPSGAVTPIGERDYIEDYTPAPERYRGSVLGALMQLRDWVGHAAHPEHHRDHDRQRRTHEVNIPPHAVSTPFTLYTHASTGDLRGASPTPSNGPTPTDSGFSTPRGWRASWHLSGRHNSQNSLQQLIGSSGALGSPAAASFSEEVSRRLRKHKDEQKRPGLGERLRSSGSGAVETLSRWTQQKQDIKRVKRNISETIQRQKYLVKLCRLLITYGAPTHRLEEYLTMSSRQLEIEAHFLYLPGAMIVSFQDPVMHTTDVRLIKAPTAVDLRKMRDVHEIYKDVVHDQISAQQGLQRLHEVSIRPLWPSRIWLIPVYGIASASVGPFAFNAQWIDLPFSFLLGCLLGYLQLFIAPMDRVWADVFEVVATVLTSCLARLLGSINGGDFVCFSNLAASALALILPGYIVLMASLELQSRNIIAGSVRMVYAIIYTLTLGYGLTIGIAIAGAMLGSHASAPNANTCNNPIPNKYNTAFVAVFTVCLIVINRGTLKQMPMMLAISLIGYLANYYTGTAVRSTQIQNTVGALAIGFLANLYARCGTTVEYRLLIFWDTHLRRHWRRFAETWLPRRAPKDTPSTLESGAYKEKQAASTAQAPLRIKRAGRGLAAAMMLPAILVQVPSGIAVNGSLTSGLDQANLLTNGTMAVTTTSTVEDALSGPAFNVGIKIVQVAIGLTTGLFLSAALWYPRGKKTSGLFSF